MASSTFTAEDDITAIIAMISAQLPAPDAPFTMLIRMQMKPGSAQQVAEAFAQAQIPTLEEAGAIDFHMNRETAEPHCFVVYERWRSIADLDAHLRTPYIARLRDTFNGLLVQPPQLHVLTPVGV